VIFRRSLPVALLLLGTLPLSGPPLVAQVERPEPGSSLDIGLSEIGISIGSSPRWTGVRLNWSDRYIERINGLNFTLWKPGEAVGGEVNGLALGILGPRAARLRGISLGLLGVLPERSAAGVTVGGLGVVSEGELRGLSLGLLGVVSEARAVGVTVGGLGIVVEGGALGINLAGLGAVSEGPVAGINLAGLGVVSERSVSGVSLAGLGLVTEERLRGVSVAGLGAVAGRSIDGLAAALAKLDTRDLNGVGVAAWNRVRGRQRGLTVGLFNQVEQLQGVSLGLLNYAGNNHGLARWTPILNLHLD
jgi:hypothetical protein